VPRHAGSLTVRANVPGFVTVEGNPACHSRALPLENCALPDGSHHIHVYGDDPRLEYSFRVAVSGEPVERVLEFALVEARPGYHLVGSEYGPSIRRAAFRGDGHQAVVVVNEASGERVSLEVPLHADQTVLVP
jgi:hypothetical protein